MHVGLLRAVGAATAVYGVVVAAWPGVVARPSGLVDGEDWTGEATRVSLRSLGWRDAVSGTALVVAPEGPALKAAAGVRMAADYGDAALLTKRLPGPWRWRAAVAVSAGWGTLTAAGLLWPRRRP